jgi:uncharacterized membrane protein (UPF0127 family)
MAAAWQLTIERFASLALIGVFAAFLALGPAGCDDRSGANIATVSISGKKFHLELALDVQTRFRGLSERTFIEPDGGMLFVFPREQVAVHGFVMRDCPIPIDIIYLDSAGRVVASHQMTPEPPRDATKGEGTPADANNPAYNSRLKPYSSRFPAQFVIELAGGTLKTLKVSDGDLITFDRDGLLKRAR